MVVSGTYQTLTKDLDTQDYNGIYSGTMPANDLVVQHPFDNRLNDPQQKAEGDQITFRGTQTGVQDADFPGTSTPCSPCATATLLSWRRTSPEPTARRG